MSKHKYNAKTKGKFRSKLEEYCANQLWLSNIDFDYELITFVLQEGFTYDSSWEKYGKSFKKVSKVRPITYKPDFVGVKSEWIIETKGMRTEAFNIKWKMFKNFLFESNLNYLLFTPSNHKEVNASIEIIKEIEGTI